MRSWPFRSTRCPYERCQQRDSKAQLNFHDVHVLRCSFPYCSASRSLVFTSDDNVLSRCCQISRRLRPWRLTSRQQRLSGGFTVAISCLCVKGAREESGLASRLRLAQFRAPRLRLRSVPQGAPFPTETSVSDAPRTRARADINGGVTAVAN